mgnify:CR=1 FL=1
MNTSKQDMTGFDLYLETGEESYKQLQRCTPAGQRIRYPGFSSAIVPLAETNIVVELPAHRCFFIVNPFGHFEPIVGKVNLPVSSSETVMSDQFMQPGSIIEVDSKFLGSGEHFLYKNDINTRFIKTGVTYMLSAQLTCFRGTEVTSVGYLELSYHAKGSKFTKNNHLRKAILRSITNLDPHSTQIFNAYKSVVAQQPDKLKHSGNQVLSYASTVGYHNVHLVIN